ncbi:hypothetical protein KC717_03800 [Candidatus Dojkabacteria bacterium]|uniref:Uncharacterized protein n=1 Tax=Candidatus Dojkabacteria bacterium TaxID=2099670 RepID=A0A955L921_9BACT|nr:hypothetical protein [Candidatus Dojkabacteria bacterium]
MAKTLSNVISLEFYNKKTNKIEKTFDQIKRVAKFIGRANDPTKCIGNKNTKILLANIADQINRSKTGIIFIDHDWISEITEARRRQNTNIIDELTDIFHFDYHRFIIFEGEKKCYGYTVKYTDDGIERINNPELFYPELFNKKFQINSKKNYSIEGKKLPDIAQKIALHEAKNCAIHAQVQYRDLDILDINTDLSDLCSSEDSSLGNESQDPKNQDTNFISSNRTELEANTEFHSMSRVDRMIAREQARRERDALEGNSFEEILARAKAQRDKERLVLTKQQETAGAEPPKVVPDQKPQGPTPNSELLEFARQEMLQVKEQQNDTHTRNGNVYHGNKLLNEFEFTDDLIDVVLEKSDKPHFSRERVRAIMRNIVVSNPNLRIWGGKNAFINYMVKAINNEKEFTKEEKAQSLAEMKRKEAEQVMYDFQHRVIRYF